MTRGLANEIRRLKGRFWAPEDQEFLGAILAADEAGKANGKTSGQAMFCANCNASWPISLLDEFDRCPDCVLIWMHETFSRRRAARMMNGL